MPVPAKDSRSGYAYALAAFGLWGVIPLFFKALQPVDDLDIVAHRVLYAVPVLGLFLLLRGRWGEVRAAFANRKVLLTLCLTAVLIGINWVVYVIGVNNDRVLATSLGYYLNPLLNILIGRYLLGEALDRLRWSALFLAGAGVAVLSVGALADFWITITLALSFGFYGYFRKKVDVGAAPGLLVETILFAPLCILWLGAFRDMGDPLLGPSTTHTVLLLISGAVTAIPLLLFTEGARRLRYSTVGIIQFMAPSMQFLLAVFLFGETFTPTRAIAFAAIWGAMALYIYSLAKEARDERVTLVKQSADG